MSTKQKYKAQHPGYKKLPSHTTNTTSTSYHLNHSKSFVQQLKINKALQLQKLRLQASMQLTNTKKFGFDNNNDQEQVSDVEEMKATHSQSLGNKKTITGKYFRINAQKDNLYKLRRERKYHNMVSLHKDRQDTHENIEEMHTKSFTIKQLKPERKQIFPKTVPIYDPTFGKTYGSYYQIVAIQKKFENSRYFFNQHPGYIMGRDNNQQLGRKYHSRITNNPQFYRDHKNKNKINYEGGFIEPWNLHDDNLPDGFDVK